MVPTFASFYFSLTRWTLFDVEFIGLDNFVQFFHEPMLVKGFTNTLIYGVVTSGLKVVLGLLLAVLLTSPILGRGYLRAVVFFPVLVSTIGVGIMFKVLMDPFDGLINQVAGGCRHRWTRVADRPVLGAHVDRACRRLEGRRTGDPHLHRWHRLDTPRLLRGGEDRRRERAGRTSGTSRFRWSGRRR